MTPAAAVRPRSSRPVPRNRRPPMSDAARRRPPVQPQTRQPQTVQPQTVQPQTEDFAGERAAAFRRRAVFVESRPRRSRATATRAASIGPWIGGAIGGAATLLVLGLLAALAGGGDTTADVHRRVLAFHAEIPREGDWNARREAFHRFAVRLASVDVTDTSSDYQRAFAELLTCADHFDRVIRRVPGRGDTWGQVAFAADAAGKVYERMPSSPGDDAGFFESLVHAVRVADGVRRGVDAVGRPLRDAATAFDAAMVRLDAVARG